MGLDLAEVLELATSSEGSLLVLVPAPNLHPLTKVAFVVGLLLEESAPGVAVSLTEMGIHSSLPDKSA